MLPQIALFSIKPKFADLILDGTKKYEFRKTLIRQKIDYMLIYATAPVKALAGIAKIEKVIIDKTHSLWDETKEESGLSENEFFRYFQNQVHKTGFSEISYKKQGCALKIESVRKFEKPIDPHTVFLGFTPPQSFMGVKLPWFIRKPHEFLSFCDSGDATF